MLGYVSRDTVLEGDEGVSWKAKAYYSGSELAFLAEADWEDPKTVHRITILSPQVKEGALAVGRRFGEIRRLVSPGIPSVPDGYLFVRGKEDSTISIELDISGGEASRRLFQGVADLAAIPDTLRVVSIVVMDDGPAHRPPG
jgi:hypothetical protein